MMAPHSKLNQTCRSKKGKTGRQHDAKIPAFALFPLVEFRGSLGNLLPEASPIGPTLCQSEAVTYDGMSVMFISECLDSPFTKA